MNKRIESRSSLNPSYYGIGALDRYNLGDLLFADLASKHFPSIEFYSPSGGDFSSFKGVISKPLSQLPKEGNYIFIGGEILSSSWSTAIRDTKAPGFADKFKAIQKVRMKFSTKEFFLKKTGDSAHPYIPTHLELSQNRFAYVSVGGRTNSEWFDHLSPNQTYLSVRDLRTRQHLGNISHEIHLAPDPVASLALYPDLVPKTDRENGLLIQCSLNWYKKKHNQELLNSIILDSKLKRIPVSFCSFGFTQNHADQVAYSLIANKHPEIKYIEVRSTQDHISAVANSTLMLASSLHAHIISMALGKANIPLPGIDKISNYIETWVPEIVDKYKIRLSLHDAMKFNREFAPLFLDRSRELAQKADRNYQAVVNFLKT